MLNKLSAFVREYRLIAPGDTVTCAVSGGADSVALLFGLYLLREKLGITLKAAHFNHHLRGDESDRDEQFVCALCDRYDIPLSLGAAQILPGKKGLEAAAREARYAFFATLEGKIATAHTADDNAETVLLHLVRGTGLKGLGGIAPVNGNIIRPMLSVTRQEVLAFLGEYCLDFVQDSSNDTDLFLRNRIRHRVMPLLRQENPRLGENLSEMALALRADEAYLQVQARARGDLDVSSLRQTDVALRRRIIENFLKENGVREPEFCHICAVDDLIFSQNPSACIQLPGNVTLERCYNTLRLRPAGAITPVVLPCPGELELGDLGLRVICTPAQQLIQSRDTFTVHPQGKIWLRGRLAGDEMRLSGGTKSLKKLFIDRKIPASDRPRIGVLADEGGVLAVDGIGVNEDRKADTLPAVQIKIIKKG